MIVGGVAEAVMRRGSVRRGSDSDVEDRIVMCGKGSGLTEGVFFRRSGSV